MNIRKYILAFSKPLLQHSFFRVATGKTMWQCKDPLPR